MSVKPVDLQVMLPKIAEVSKVSNDEQQRNQAMQQHQAAMVQHKADDSLRQVYTKDRIQDVKVREKQEKDRENRKEGRKKEEEAGTNSKEPDVKDRNCTIDIRL